MSRMNSRESRKRVLKNKTEASKRVAKSEIVEKSVEVQKEKETVPAKKENPNSFHFLSSITVLEKFNFKFEVSDDNHLKKKCIFIQDSFMKKFFEDYPQFICFDILCEIPQLDTSLILLIGLDGNGHCEIISVGLIKSEDADAFTWLCDVFKKNNLTWKNVDLVLSDRNIDRAILQNAFPEKWNFLSFFHCMKAFKKDLSNLDPSVPSQDINKALLLFEQMMFITSESGYQELLRQMKLIHPQVYSLFKRNWHQKKSLWTLGLCTDSKIFLKAFNTYLLNIRRRIKPVISTQESYESIIQNLHSAILKLRKETFQKFTSILHSPAVSNVRAMQRYKKDLTPFAVELINEQLMKSESMQDVKQIDHATFMVDGTSASYRTCSCNFHTLMMLPCCHILKVRKHLAFPLYYDSFKPWSSEHYLSSYFDLYYLYVRDLYEESKAKEKFERYQELVKISIELWPEFSDCLETVSQVRLEVTQDLLKAWKSGFKMDVSVTDGINDPTDINSEAMKDMPTDAFKQMYGISLGDILDSENDFSDVPLYSEDSLDSFFDF